jgi:hypothetical protein
LLEPLRHGARSIHGLPPAERAHLEQVAGLDLVEPLLVGGRQSGLNEKLDEGLPRPARALKIYGHFLR